MSETKHTPGLLVVVEKGMWEVEVQAQSGGTTCVLTNDNDWFPNEEGGARGRSHKTLMADAHLYAAAPDLLAALERLDVLFDFGEPIKNGEPSIFVDASEINAAMEQAKAAITKAKGETV